MKRKSPIASGTAKAGFLVVGAVLATATCATSNAAQPPQAAADAEAASSDAGERRSPFGGLGRLFKRSKPEPTTEAAPAPATSAQPGEGGEEAGDRSRRGLRALFGAWDSGRAAEDQSPNAGQEADAAGASGEAGAESPDPSRVNKFVITENKVSFFEDSPLQTRGADEVLGKGTIVTVVKMRRGWTDVVLESGKFGTVSTDVLRKAMASDFPVPEFVVKDLERSAGVAAYYEQMANLPPVPPPALPDESQAVEEGELLGNPLLLLPPLDPAPPAETEADSEESDTTGSTSANGEAAADPTPDPANEDGEPAE